MKKFFLMAALCLFGLTASAQVASIVGDWKTVDDKSGEVRSVVHIYKASDGLYYGRIDELVGQPQDLICTPCEGADAGKKVVGLVIIRGMHAEGDALVNGKILDPESGKIYYCSKIALKDGKLLVRGSLDKKGFLGRNQTWVRK